MNKSLNIKKISLGTLGVLLLQGSLFAQNKEVKPNVLFIMADDLGYGDLGCYGATKISTPNIDKLAKEGRLFTDAHSASSVSTPSRYSLLTGKYPFRGSELQRKQGMWDPLPRDSRLIVETDILTVGKMMQRQGYNTACIGKWHLGFTNEQTDWNKPLRPGPLEVGFDYYFGVPLVNSGPPFVYVENDRVVGLDPNDPIVLKKDSPATATQLYPDKSHNPFSGGKKAHALYKDDEVGFKMVEKTKEWIDANKDESFFLYLATTHIHHPFSPNKKFQGSSQAGRYGDFVQEFDWMIGEVLEYLEKEGLAENTLVILTSDNGGMLNVGGQEAWDAGHKINGDLFGFKFDVWEGGHRVPYIARWPKHIEADTKSDQLISNIDLFATLASLTGYELKDGDAPDSYNLLEAMIGDPDNMVRDHFVMSSHKKSHMSIRVGDWIYIPQQGGGGWVGGKRGDHIFGGIPALEYTHQKNGDIENGQYKKNTPKAQLYNIKQDPSQSSNMIKAHRGIANMMNTTLNIIKQSNSTRGAN